MPRYLFEIWAGSGEHWNTQPITATARSVEAARRTVAECLGLAPARWPGNAPPLDLVVPSIDLALKEPAQPRPRRHLVRERGRERGDVAVGAREAIGAWIRLVESLATQAGVPHSVAGRKA
jgi:hypothetical protein